MCLLRPVHTVRVPSLSGRGVVLPGRSLPGPLLGLGDAIGGVGHMGPRAP